MPPLANGFSNGSLPSVLKLYGDINGDGKMVYVEYTCDPAGRHRQSLSERHGVRSAPPQAGADAGQILLSNISNEPRRHAVLHLHADPLPIVNVDSYVLDVAITLTVQTQVVDPSPSTTRPKPRRC